MEILEENQRCFGKRFSIKRDGKEIGRAFLYLCYNDLHSRPFGFLEDVFIDEKERGNGIGTELVNFTIQKAKELDCYKLIATSRLSRPKVHQLYRQLGFTDYGKEFRMNL